MIIGPAPLSEVELLKQIGCDMPSAAWDVLNASRKSLDVFLGGLDERVPARSMSTFCRGSRTPFVTVRNDRLLEGKFQSSFLQERIDGGVSLLRQ